MRGEFIPTRPSRCGPGANPVSRKEVARIMIARLGGYVWPDWINRPFDKTLVLSMAIFLFGVPAFLQILPLPTQISVMIYLLGMTGFCLWEVGRVSTKL